MAYRYKQEPGVGYELVNNPDKRKGYKQSKDAFTFTTCIGVDGFTFPPQYIGKAGWR